MKKLKIFIAMLMCFVCVFACTCCGSGANVPSDPDSGKEPPSEGSQTPETPEPEPQNYVTPVVHINVEGNKPVVSKEEYLPSSVTLIDDNGGTALEGVSAGVRGRGNYTWTLKKKGYRIKFDKKQQMLSDYKCKSWALLPNYTDKTLLRNYYAFQVARGMDGLDWATDAKLVELYLNDEYLGVYLLCDQTQVDKNRVDVEEDSTDADTGFLIERDHYALTDPALKEGRDYFTIADDLFDMGEGKIVPIPYVLKSPEYPEKSDYVSEEEFAVAEAAYLAQFEYMKDYMTRAFHAAVTGDYAAFKTLCDENSFVDYFLLDQVMANWEIDRYSSFYFHKDKGGELVAGPVWDFDIAAGYYDPNPAHGIKESNNWFLGLRNTHEGNDLKNTLEFKKLYADRLEKHTALFKSELEKLKTVAEKNAAAIARNNEKWPISEWVYPMPEAMSAIGTYEGQLDFFVNYITRRIGHLNDRVSSWRLYEV